MTCPHIITRNSGAQYCSMTEQAVRERDAEIERLEANLRAIEEMARLALPKEADRDRLAAENERLQKRIELGDEVARAIQAHFYYGGADTLQRTQQALRAWEAFAHKLAAHHLERHRSLGSE